MCGSADTGFLRELSVGVRGFEPPTPASRRQLGIFNYWILNDYLEMPVDASTRLSTTELNWLRQRSGRPRIASTSAFDSFWSLATWSI